MDPIRNFGKASVSTGYDDVAVTIVLESGMGALLPDPSTEGAFNLVWWDWTTYKDPADDPKKEIARCTARTADTLTLTRAQEGTVASTKNTGGSTYKVSLDFTKKQHDDILSEIALKSNTANPTFTGTVTTPVIKITTGAGLNKILYSAADGTASWGAAPISFAWGASITGSSGTGLTVNPTSTATGISTTIANDGGTGISIIQSVAGTSSRGIKIDPAATGTGIGIEFKNLVSGLTKMGGDGFKGIYFPTMANGSDFSTVMGTRYGIYFDTMRGSSSDNGTGTQYGIYFKTVRFSVTQGKAYPIYFESLGSSSGTPSSCIQIATLSSQNAYGVRIENLGATGEVTTPDVAGFYIGALSSAYSRGTSGRFYYFQSVQQDEFYSRVSPMAQTIVQRINTRNSLSYADNYNIHEIKHKSGQFTAGGTFSDAGAVLYCEALVQTTAGSFTHTRDVYNATQSATVTTGKLFTGVVGTTERFKVHPMVPDGASAIAYLFDTTTALANAGAKIASFRVAGVEKAYIDLNGNFITV